ncbi:MAG: MFS transporter, partial [Rhodobacteraceae bacterium]|nr:MFS transporter [Paracoccaceae bacterium]
MTDLTAQPMTPARSRRNLTILILAQAILGAQMPMIFTIGALAGQALSPNPCWATLPITMVVLGSMLSSTPLSALMQRHGRRTGFWVGTAGGMLGAIMSAAGLYTSSFLLFLAGSLLTGVYMSSQGFYRFAAADVSSPAFRPKA